MNTKEGIALVKRRLVIIGVLLVFLVCSKGSAFAAGTDKVSVYENKTYNFKLEYPEGWMVKEEFMGSVACFISMSEPASESRPNFNVVVGDLSDYPNRTLEKYGELSLMQLGRIITDFKLVRNERCSLSSNPAIMYIFDGKQGVYNLRWMQVYTLYNNKAYVITFTQGNTQFDKYEEIAKKIINSFTIN